ncbi:MAG: 5' nucleotidase, deoxy (Pyrimidine), type C protein (NT5C) [Candidatus Methanocomedens sp.]|nr:MAG: 5' nucleotidase, deoxy (Pyrimidine), type C protein (NT5C) [ANME-2 cluster archaeon]
MTYKNIVISDIDGCLTDYPNVFLSYVADNMNLSFNNIQDLKNSISNKKYKSLKNLYRTSGVKKDLPIKPGAKETFEEFKRQNRTIWIVTTRPKCEPVVSDTIHWLNKKGIIYDDIFFVDDKVSFFKTIIKYGILIVIDDEEHVTDFAIETLDAYAFLFNNGIKYMEHENRIRVDNWNDVQKNITCNKYHSK